MNWPFYLLIVVWAIFGLIALIWPKKVKAWPKTFMTVIPHWLWGVIILGLAYFIWQSQFFFIYPLVVQIIAIAAGIKGLLLLLMSKNKLENLSSCCTNFPDIFYRIFGILCLVVAFLMYQGLL